MIAIANEAPAKLIVDPPMPEPMAQGRVFIQYQIENLRVLPMFGKGALDVSPRIGHILLTRYCGIFSTTKSTGFVTLLGSDAHFIWSIPQH